MGGSLKGEKTYLMKKKEFSGQLNELDCEQLVYIINYWRLGFGKLNASAMTEKKKLIEIVLMAALVVKCEIVACISSSSRYHGTMVPVVRGTMVPY